MSRKNQDTLSRGGAGFTNEKERMALEKVVKDIFSKYDPDNAPTIVGMIPPMRNAVAELKDGVPLSEVMSQLEADVMLEYFPEEFKARGQQEIEAAAQKTTKPTKPSSFTTHCTT